MMTRQRTIGFITAALFIVFAPPQVHARIEIYLMGQTVGLKPPPLDNGIRFRGTPFGHMALYVESAAYDDKDIIRQAGEGERAGLVLTVDRRLKDSFFTATTRDEFFYGGLDPKRLPASVSRADIAADLARFNEKYGRLYEMGPGISGLGQDYGALYIRDVWGLVYPTTREEERRIIEYWRKQRHDDFARLGNNCVTTILCSLNNAGLEDRGLFIRGLAPYNAWTYLVKKFLWAGKNALAPDGNYYLRDGGYITYYRQLPSEAVYRSGRPFNVYCLKNLAYVVWAGPRASVPLPDFSPLDYADYPQGDSKATGRFPYSSRPRRGGEFWFRWYVSQSEEFVRLWFQSFKGLWFLAGG